MSRSDAISQNGNTGEHYPEQFYITTNRKIAGTYRMLVSWPEGQKDQLRFEVKNNCKVISKVPA